MARYEKNGKIGSAAASVAGVLAMLAMASAAAAVTVDGRVEPGEYLTGYELNFLVEDAGMVGGGELWLHRAAGGDLVVAFTLPKTLVDNSYGSTAIGWGTAAPSGKNHNFQDLLGSDDGQFAFEFVLSGPSATTLLDVTMDYLHGLGNKKEDPPYVGGVTDGKEFEVTVGDAADIVASSTSLAYNWNTFVDPNDPNDPDRAFFGKDSDSPVAGPDYENPTLPGWLYEVTYEFQIAGDVFSGVSIDLNDPSFLSIPLIHASPNKIGKNEVRPQIGPQIPSSPPVPEPVTLVSLLGGVGALVGYVRRRRAA
ncbi:MAG TPA: PEP-CTERM sorting domain-containing protein [Phycisphaerae bacterium]|nr:PEP-CTERM sorting domain-containing protein [Phycisphaerae bacterium]